MIKMLIIPIYTQTKYILILFIYFKSILIGWWNCYFWWFRKMNDI